MMSLVVVLAGGCLVLAMLWRREAALRAVAERRGFEEQANLRDQRERELKEQGQRTSALFDRMVEGIIVVDATGRVLLSNRAAGSLFSMAGSPQGKTILEATRHHEVAAIAGRLVGESEILGYELRIDGAGAPRFLQINALALKDSQGLASGGILVFHDLTRLRQLEAVRQEFVANVSHELRTPLSLIKSATETLIDGAKDDPAAMARFLEIIDRHANRLTLLIDDLLLLSSLDSGFMRLQLQAVSLRSAVRDVLDDHRAKASARGITLEDAVPSDLGAQADPDRLRQVLSNLVDNAIKYGKSSGSVRVSALRRPDGRVEVSVQDDGPGIPDEAKDRIFERFYRVDKARSREQGGTGLGLAIVKHVVQAHGGEVKVESSLGHGCVFSFTLPALSGATS